MKPLFSLFLVHIACMTASADVRLTHLFGDHMILQQQSTNAIWGVANPGEKVTVTASCGAEASAVADKAGDWKVFLKTPAFGTGHSLTDSGNIAVKSSSRAVKDMRCADR